MPTSKILRVVLFAALSATLVVGAAVAQTTAHKVDTAAIATTIKAEMGETYAGINAHDVAQATKWEADDIVTMEAGRAPSKSLKEDREGMTMAFKYAPSWRVRMIDQTVDVASAGDMAIYRSTCWQDSDADDHTPMTEKVDFVAEFKKQQDGAWKMAWSVVTPQERPHKR